VAARLLKRAPETEARLEARLVALGYRRETAAATVARCRELGYVGDTAFAQERARTLRARGAGRLRIEADLTARGLREALIAEAVEASRAGEPEAAWARRALRGVCDRRRACGSSWRGGFRSRWWSRCWGRWNDRRLHAFESPAWYTGARGIADPGSGLARRVRGVVEEGRPLDDLAVRVRGLHPSAWTFETAPRFGCSPVAAPGRSR